MVNGWARTKISQVFLSSALVLTLIWRLGSKPLLENLGNFSYYSVLKVTENILEKILILWKFSKRLKNITIKQPFTWVVNRFFGLNYVPSKNSCWSSNQYLRMWPDLEIGSFFTEVFMLKWAKSNMTRILIKRGDLDIDTDWGKTRWRHRENTATCKPKREAWNRSFPHGPQKEPALLILLVWDF